MVIRTHKARSYSESFDDGASHEIQDDMFSLPPAPATSPSMDLDWKEMKEILAATKMTTSAGVAQIAHQLMKEKMQNSCDTIETVKSSTEDELEGSSGTEKSSSLWKRMAVFKGSAGFQMSLTATRQRTSGSSSTTQSTSKSSTYFRGSSNSTTPSTKSAGAAGDSTFRRARLLKRRSSRRLTGNLRTFSMEDSVNRDSDEEDLFDMSPTAPSDPDADQRSEASLSAVLNPYDEVSDCGAPGELLEDFGGRGQPKRSTMDLSSHTSSRPAVTASRMPRRRSLGVISNTPSLEQERRPCTSPNERIPLDLTFQRRQSIESTTSIEEAALQSPKQSPKQTKRKTTKKKEDKKMRRHNSSLGESSVEDLFPEKPVEDFRSLDDKYMKGLLFLASSKREKSIRNMLVKPRGGSVCSSSSGGISFD